MGTLSVQTAFASSVATWLASSYAAGRRIQTPNHLLRTHGFDAAPVQMFWLAEEMARCSKGVEDMAMMIRRKAMADFLCAYHEVVDHVRQRAAQDEIQLGHENARRQKPGECYMQSYTLISTRGPGRDRSSTARKLAVVPTISCKRPMEVSGYWP